jgi:formate-dependent nitrite reductase membrane component NrfD
MSGSDANAGDGRNIDPVSGLLIGEASDQKVQGDRSKPEGSTPHEVWGQMPSSNGGTGDPTYYDRPVLKRPVWKWYVPAYFYAGGVAGASMTLGALAQLAGRRDLAVRCRWLAAGGGAVGTALLIADLGRPERFLNMLRVFRPTSPMSVGSFVLAGAAPLAAGSAILSNAPQPLRALGDAAALGAGVLGSPLAGYTAVLVSNTAVPVWQQSRRSLPPLFVASAMSSAASLLELLRQDERDARTVHRFGVAGKVAELASALALEREAAAVEVVAKPLKQGRSGVLWKASKLLTAASLALSLLPGERSRTRTIAAAVLGTACGLAVRFAVMEAGKASAADPRATFQMQREGHGAAELAV